MWPFNKPKQMGSLTSVPKVTPKKPPMKVTDTLLSNLMGRFNSESASQKTASQVFVLPPYPPSVKAKQVEMAMDDAITGTNTWANSFALSGYYNEGITFMGYPYLSELAQRPEYRVMAETLATEMTRKWIEFTSVGDEDKSDRIKELEAEFVRLNVRDMFAKATEQDGFFGRGHIYIDTGDTDNSEELQSSIGDGWDALSKTKIQKGSIKALRTVEAVWCYPVAYNSNDPLKDNWYRPDMWMVQAKTVHSSRLVTFIAREVPDMLKPTYAFGGLSLSQMAKPYVDNWLQTRQSVNDIVSAFSVFVLKSNLAESLQGDGSQLFARATLFNLLRSNRGLMMVDKDSEDFMNVSASLSGLDALQAQSQEHMASVSHIPIVKLLGIQPAGLNASSEGEIRSFYDWINANQESQYRDKIKRMMGYIMLSLWGETDGMIDFKFVPLWALDEAGEATVEKTKADTDVTLIGAGVISPEEARTRIANDPASGYSNIDVDDMPKTPEVDEPEDPERLDDDEVGAQPKQFKEAAE